MSLNAFRGSWGACLAVFVALVPALALAVGEQTGRLSGRITEAGTSAPVPGATVSITSPALPGGAQTTTTAEDGFYQFDLLPPGVYTVEVSYEGMKPLVRQTTVQVGTLTPLDIAWSAELAQTETTVVVQRQTMTRPESTTQGKVLTADQQAKTHSGRTFQRVAQQVAGVTGGANPDVRGGSSSMNRYLIDGLDTTDPASNTFSANVNFDSLTSFEVLTGGMEAQYNSMGGVINLVTAAGSDEFKIDTSLYANHYRLSAPSQFGATAFSGFQPFNETPRPPTQSIEGNLNVSGPIIKQKLWYATSLAFEDSAGSVPAGPPLNVQAPNQSWRTFLGRAKLTYAPSARHRLTLTGSTDPTRIGFRYNRGAEANYMTPAASIHQDQGGAQTSGTWEFFISDAVTYRLQAGANYNYINFGPEGAYGSLPDGYENVYSEEARRYDYNRPGHVNLTDGTWWYNYPYDLQERRNRYQLDQALIWRFNRAGRHEAQFGIQGAFVQRRNYVSIPGRGVLYVDRGGPSGEAGLCLDEALGSGCFEKSYTPDFNQRQLGGSLGFYAQDRWKLTSWLTLLPGLRFDYGTTRDNASRVVSRLWGWGPRLGTTVDLTRDQKTIFGAYYGRSNEVLSLAAAGHASETPATQNFLYDGELNQFVPNGSSGGPGSIVLDPKGRPPHSDEVHLSLRREVVPGAAATLAYTWKRISNIWAMDEINAIWDPSGTRVIGFNDGQNRAVYKLTRPDDNRIHYNGFDVILEGQPSDRLSFYGAYTLAFKTGPGAEELPGPSNSAPVFSPFMNPRQLQFYDGYTFGDIRHMVKVSGSYTIRNFTIGPNFRYQSGALLAKVYSLGDANSTTGVLLRSPLGTQTDPDNPNEPTNISEFRTPDLIVFNLRAQYNFQELLNQNLAIIADVDNVLNLGTPTSINSALLEGGTFGTVSSRLSPLSVQLGVRYIY